ncbi:MAG: hypothetical protein AAFS07_17480 [Pseudomonadota bacterium]
MGIPEQQRLIDVLDQDEVLKVLSDDRFVPVDYGDRHAALGDRLGLDFSAITFAIEHIPLCQHGERHAESRKRMAQVIADGRARMVARIPEHVERRLAPLRVPGRHDAIDAIVNPLVNDLISDLIGVKLDVGPDSNVSGIFSQAAGVSKRKRMQAELQTLRERLEEAFGDQGVAAVGDRVGLAILGRDATLGTLSFSMAAHIERAEGRPLSTVVAEPTPTHTGVPYVDRRPVPGLEEVAAEPQRRVHLSAFEEAENARDRHKFFGAGIHVCLGRPLTLDLWKHVAAYMADCDRQVRVLELRTRKDDVFRCPDIFQIEVV